MDVSGNVSVPGAHVAPSSPPPSSPQSAGSAGLLCLMALPLSERSHHFVGNLSVLACVLFPHVRRRLSLQQEFHGGVLVVPRRSDLVPGRGWGGWMTQGDSGATC